ADPGNLVAGDGRHGPGHQAGGWLARSGVLPAAAGRTGRICVRCPQVPQHAYRCRARWAATMGSDAGSAHHACRADHPQDPCRRAAPDPQRAARADESRRAAPGAPAVRRTACAECPLLRTAALRQAGYHRLGAAVLSLRLLGAGRSREAAIRSILHQEQHSAFRFGNPRPDGRGGFPGTRRALMEKGSVFMSISAGASPGSANEGHRRKLLILANDRALRRELEQIFADLDVTVSETSEQVLVLLRRLEPDVVLFDLGAARTPPVAAQSLE